MSLNISSVRGSDKPGVVLVFPYTSGHCEMAGFAIKSTLPRKRKT